MVHIGIDHHKHVSQIAVLDEDSEVRQHRFDNDPVQIEEFFRTIPTPSQVAIEATGTWWWIVDLIREAGHDVVLSNPKQTKAIAAARLKNDKVDAGTLPRHEGTQRHEDRSSRSGAPSG
jgi:transposase